MEFLLIFLWSLLGVIIGGIISLFPSLHIYNIAGIALLIWQYIQGVLPDVAIGPFFISLVISFAFMNTVPMTLINAPDETASVTILPGNRFTMTGRGYEAVMLTGIGSLAGIIILVLLTPFTLYVLPRLHKILSPHLHWILVLVMVYMLMSEWPKSTGAGRTIWQKFRNAWRNLIAGIATFVFSGILGLIVITKSIISPEIGFQNILPVFIGLFAIPSIIQNLISKEDIPEQYISKSVELKRDDFLAGAFQGTVGGTMAAYLPAVTSGIGGIMAGHMLAWRGDIIFLISGGVSKVIYYVGAFLLLFVVTPLTPNGIGRGGLSMILRPVFSSEPGQYWVIISVILFAGLISFLLLEQLTKVTIRVLKKVSYRKLYVVALILIIALIIGLTGLPGLFVMSVATCIGMIPVFFHSRRSNCMAVLLVPIALNMAGYGSAIADILRLY